jgi:hypothetical protein
MNIIIISNTISIITAGIIPIVITGIIIVSSAEPPVLRLPMDGCACVCVARVCRCASPAAWLRKRPTPTSSRPASGRWRKRSVRHAQTHTHVLQTRTR